MILLCIFCEKENFSISSKAIKGSRFSLFYYYKKQQQQKTKQFMTR